MYSKVLLASYDKAIELFNDGYSQRKISEELKIGRNTIALIVSGSWSNKHLTKTTIERPLLLHIDDIENYNRVRLRIVRCVTCGARVILPCLKCELENRK